MKVRISKGLAEELLYWGDIDRDEIEAGDFEENFHISVPVAERYLARLESVRGGGVMEVDSDFIAHMDMRIGDIEASDQGPHMARAIATAQLDMGCMVEIDPKDHYCWSSGGGRCRCIRKIDGKTYIWESRPWEQSV